MGTVSRIDHVKALRDRDKKLESMVEKSEIERITALKDERYANMRDEFDRMREMVSICVCMYMCVCVYVGVCVCRTNHCIER